jgi:hypothetical protein
MAEVMVTAKRIVEICSATIDDMRDLLPRRDSRLALLRQAAKLEHWNTGENFALDAKVEVLEYPSIFELLIDDTFGFSHGIRIAFCVDGELQLGGTIWLLGMRRENEPLTLAMIEVLRLRRELAIC